MQREILDPHTHTHTARTHMKVKAEIGVRLLHTEEHQRLPAENRKLGESCNRLSLMASEGTDPADPLILASSQCLWFQPPNLWHFLQQP